MNLWHCWQGLNFCGPTNYSYLNIVIDIRNNIPKMNLTYRLKSNATAVALLLIAGFSSCKKDSEPSTGPVDPANSSRTDLTKDSIFYYAKQVYLWNDAIPEYGVFNPRQYTGGAKDLDNYDKEVFAISQLKINPTTNKPYEYRAANPTVPKYSNIQDLQDKNPVAVITSKGSVNTEGNGYDIGIYSFGAYGNSGSNSYHLFVKAVNPGSSAAANGITRGTEITTINGKKIGSNFNSEVDLINSLLDNTTTTAKLAGFKSDGTPLSVTLTRTSYTSTPVYKEKIFTINGKKIGYLAYARFSQLSNGDSDNPSDTNLDPVFSRFAAAGVTDLIVDLRYNGGGYVNAAEYLVNLIAPSTATGTMYTEVYNPLMQANNATILSHQPLTDGAGKIRYGDNNKMLTYADVSYAIKDNTATFNKKGSLNGVKNVVFIVSGGTASASELTINCLKPVVNVKLVGQTTYGKPVGFFPVTIENRYDVYFSMFETKNSKGEGAYYAGFTPNVIDDGTNNAIIFDDASRDFGDQDESYTKSALNLLAPNAISASAKASMSVGVSSGRASVPKQTDFSDQFKPTKRFVGMLETRHKVKK
jgi:carboxyl-terminal processing protease